MIAQKISRNLCDLGIGNILRSACDKANWTSANGCLMPSIDECLKALAELRGRTGCPGLIEEYAPEQCTRRKDGIDALQITSFMCLRFETMRSTRRTDAVIYVRKFQFLAPWKLAWVAEKFTSTGNLQNLLAERELSFGYKALVTDIRVLPEWRE